MKYYKSIRRGNKWTHRFSNKIHNHKNMFDRKNEKMKVRDRVDETLLELKGIDTRHVNL